MNERKPTETRPEVTNYGHGSIKKERTQKNVYVQDPAKWEALNQYAVEHGMSQSEVIFAGLELLIAHKCHTCARISELLQASGSIIVKKGKK